MTGPLALVGGGEWQEGCDFDRTLLDVVGADEVLVLPTASAYEHPERLVEAAKTWFDDHFQFRACTDDATLKEPGDVITTSGSPSGVGDANCR